MAMTARGTRLAFLFVSRVTVDRARSPPIGQEREKIGRADKTIAVEIGRAVAAGGAGAPSRQECQQVAGADAAVAIEIAQRPELVGAEIDAWPDDAGVAVDIDLVGICNEVGIAGVDQR